MAKIQSPVWNAARGSIAGCTYLTTPSGQIIARARTHPVNPRTKLQGQIRGSLTEAVKTWDGLTVAKRDAWEVWAQSNGMHARATFLGSRAFAQYYNAASGEETVTLFGDPPEFRGRPSAIMNVIDYEGGVGTTGCSLWIDKMPFACELMIQVSPPMSQARRRYNGPWDTTKTVFSRASDAAATVVSISNLVLNRHYFFRIQMVTNGQTTPYRGTIVSRPVIMDAYAATGS